MTVWADSNVLLRFLTGDPAHLAGRARRLLRRAADGELLLRVTNVVIAEVIWVLSSGYKAEPKVVADAIRTIILAEGIVVDDEHLVMDALRTMEDAKVDYTDAFIAANARANGQPVATFDSDFRHLGVEIVS
jgi:predicted nucleic acid-binding protein